MLNNQVDNVADAVMAAVVSVLIGVKRHFMPYSWILKPFLACFCKSSFLRFL